jgi:succinate dehydrogenase cytochrome B subunit, b558 family
MGTIKKSILSSLVKKFVMAITGFVLASFLLVHMLGNLQTLEGGPHAINAYANFLQTLPWEFLWGFRCALAACFVLHFLTAYLLVVENNKARPQTYAVKKNLASTFASRTMIYTGTIVIAFGIIHILHYTMLKLNPEFKVLDWVATSGMYEGKTLHDVYAMMILGFSNTWVSLAYIFSMVVIGFHLSHGVSSMFQSVGFRDEKWRYRLNAIAVAYCVVIAAGFSINPAAVLISKYTPLEIMPVNEVVSQIEKQKAEGKSPIFVNYDFLKSDCTAAKK